MWLSVITRSIWAIPCAVMNAAARAMKSAQVGPALLVGEDLGAGATGVFVDGGVDVVVADPGLPGC